MASTSTVFQAPRSSSCCSAAPVTWPNEWSSRRSTRCFCRSCCPSDFMLIGNGRGDVSHEDFRGHVHDVLTEFGTKPEGKDWEEFADRLRFAGGGFDSNDPGSLLDVIAEAQKELGDELRADPLPRGAAGGLRRTDRRARRARPGQGRAGRLREAVRHLAGELPRADEAVHKVLGRNPGLPDRPFPGQGSHPGSARAPVRQQPVRRRVERRAHQVDPDRRAGEAWTSTTGRCSTTPPARCSTC